jgi:hypothetical protein
MPLIGIIAGLTTLYLGSSRHHSECYNLRGLRTRCRLTLAQLRLLTNDDGRACSARVRQYGASRPFTHFNLLLIIETCQFFGLFGLSNRASSMIGPNVIQVIIDHSGNNWKGFPFLFALCLSASIVIWFGVDVEKGRKDAVQWAEEEREKGLGDESRED